MPSPATTAPSLESNPRRFCRACGYDLRASSDRCPDCGREFDAANRKTFARRPPSALYRWLRRAAYGVVALFLLAAAALLWLRHGWQVEQRDLAILGEHFQQRSEDLEMKTESICPRLSNRLPDRIAIYFQRVVEFVPYGPGLNDDELRLIGGFSYLRVLLLGSDQATDAGFSHLARLTRLEHLELICRNLTDDGMKNLAGLRQLDDLTIQGGKITNASLESLHDVPHLKSFTICQNAVNREGLRRWLRQHPGVQVIDGPGGPLGPAD